jgi:hypothetical protein
MAVAGQQVAAADPQAAARTATPRPGNGITYRQAPPRKLQEDKYWCGLDGNINVEHPNCPPEVRARELEKRRRREAGEPR